MAEHDAAAQNQPQARLDPVQKGRVKGSTRKEVRSRGKVSEFSKGGRGGNLKHPKRPIEFQKNLPQIRKLERLSNRKKVT